VAHIPDGFLSVPVLAGAAGLSVATLAVAARRSRSSLGEREGPVLGAATAVVFAGQMLNFPLGVGASAHLLGATLAALLLGPWSGMLVLFAVLLVQALLFQDGGIAALGANTLNIAVLGVGSAYGIFRWVRALFGVSDRAVLVAAGVAALGSTSLVGLAVALELTWSGLVPLGPALTLVGGGHLLVGVAEAVLTTAILAFVLRSRPDLLARSLAQAPSAGRVALGMTLAALVLGLAGAYVASSQPDMLDTALERLGLTGRASPIPAPFPDYASTVGGVWVAGTIGVVAAFLVTWGVAMTAARRRR
jgi:cobalt/nickel transport system permease protein